MTTPTTMICLVLLLACSACETIEGAKFGITYIPPTTLETEGKLIWKKQPPEDTEE